MTGAGRSEGAHVARLARDERAARLEVTICNSRATHAGAAKSLICKGRHPYRRADRSGSPEIRNRRLREFGRLPADFGPQSGASGTREAVSGRRSPRRAATRIAISGIPGSAAARNGARDHV
ncbi:hypothetical protein D9X30_1057 [Cupriavidus sp. U2]|nr:hypothetical protein D9X30_1057 [Cupriavidus sp. U2]